MKELHYIMYGETFSKQAALELGGINFYKCLQMDGKAYISGVDHNNRYWLKEVHLRSGIASKKIYSYDKCCDVNVWCHTFCVTCIVGVLDAEMSIK